MEESLLEQLCYSSKSETLHSAINNGDEDCVLQLIKEGATVNGQASYLLESPLHLACSSGKLKTVKSLLDHAANINAKTLTYSTPLMAAVRAGHEEVVEYLLNIDGCLKDAMDRSGKNALLISIEQGHTSIAKQLIDKDVDINVENSQGRRPIHHAVIWRRGEIIKLLCKSNVDIDVADSHGVNPLHIAVKRGYLDVIKILINFGANLEVQNRDLETPLTEAIKVGNLKVIEELLKAGASIEHQLPYGNLLFTFILRTRYNPKILHLLLQAGIDIEYRNSYNYSALQFAVDRHWEAAVDLFIRAGWNVNAERKWLEENCYNNLPEYSERTELSVKVLYYAQKPRDLKVLCGYKIRKRLSKSWQEFLNDVEKLPIPQLMKDYILYNDLI